MNLDQQTPETELLEAVAARSQGMFSAASFTDAHWPEFVEGMIRCPNHA